MVFKLQNAAGNFGEACEAAAPGPDLIVALQNDGVATCFDKPDRIITGVGIVDEAADRQIARIATHIARAGQHQLTREGCVASRAVGERAPIETHNAREGVAHHIEQAARVNADADVLGD